MVPIGGHYQEHWGRLANTGLGGLGFAKPFVEKSYRLPVQHGKNVTVGVERSRDRLVTKQFLDDLRQPGSLMR